ncbi:MAG: hypothetical protein WC415_06095 [Patescibacteria group bacterium]|jgi:hypothetical protein
MKKIDYEIVEKYVRYSAFSYFLLLSWCTLCFSILMYSTDTPTLYTNESYMRCGALSVLGLLMLLPMTLITPFLKSDTKIEMQTMYTCIISSVLYCVGIASIKCDFSYLNKYLTTNYNESVEIYNFLVSNGGYVVYLLLLIVLIISPLNQLIIIFTNKADVIENER